MSSTQKMQDMENRGLKASATLKKVKAFFRTSPLAEKQAFADRNLLAHAEAIHSANWD